MLKTSLMDPIGDMRRLAIPQRSEPVTDPRQSVMLETTQATAVANGPERGIPSIGVPLWARHCRAASSLVIGATHAQPAHKAKNVVLVHGLFADGSSWSEVIPQLQAAGLNVTSVQNPLTTLLKGSIQPSGAAQQDGPTVVAGHSFSGMIVADAGMNPNVSAIVSVAARAPDAGEDYTALAKKFPEHPASAVLYWMAMKDASAKRFSCVTSPATCRKRRQRRSSGRWPFHKELLTGKTKHAAWRSKPS